MERGLYTAEHEEFRDVVRTFVSREIAPNLARWDDEGRVDRGMWQAAGKQGVVGLAGPERFGGAGLTDYRFRNVVHEELAAVCAGALMSGFVLQDDILIPYFTALADETQAQRWLPGLCAGDLIASIAMTEPGTGSDLRGIRTAAERVTGGWRLNGSKTFITAGYYADIVVVVARTDPAGGSDAFSLLVVEDGAEGFSRGRKLKKIGQAAQDTAELFFTDVFVPDTNVLGEVGAGFRQLLTHLPRERLAIAAQAIAAADAAFAWTKKYVEDRHAFGQRISDFQNTRFLLAEISTELDVTRAYVDKALIALSGGELTAVEAAKVKWWATDMQVRTIDRLLQLFGGYGYMHEYPIARAYMDARAQRIVGGTNEIMKRIIGNDIFGRA